MRKLELIFLSIFLWFVSLLQGSGLGEVLKVTTVSHIVLIIYLIFILIRNRNKTIYIEKKLILIITFVIATFVLIPYLIHRNSIGINYLFVFLTILVFFNYKLEENIIKKISLIYGFLGSIFLFFYNFTPIFSGWNSNAVAMLGFFSYSIFFIGFADLNKFSNNKIMLVVGVIYILLLDTANSRSSNLFVIIALLMIFKIIKIKLFYSKKNRFIMLIIPIIVVFVVLTISNSSFYEEINAWSYLKFNKTIFNGRDGIWEYGFKLIKNNLLLGTGNLENGWHNSAITCLTAYGLIGYISWIGLLKYIIELSKNYIFDNYIIASLVAFFLIYLQQSVELGFIGTQPSFIPYIALGIMLGRVRYLKEKKKYG